MSIQYEYHHERQKDLLLNIKTYFDLDRNETIFQKRNILKRVPFEGREYIVKSFKIPHLINQIAYGLFRDGKAKKSYYNSIKIIDFVPAPIGYIEFKKGVLLKESYFISEPFEYDFTIREPLTMPDFPNKTAIYHALARFTHQLHQRGVLHLDYSPGNILIKVHQGWYEFKIIDLNRMKFKPLSTQERLENFSKLWASDEDLATIIHEYTKISKINTDNALNIALKASHQHKKKTNLKRKIQGKEILD